MDLTNLQLSTNIDVNKGKGDFNIPNINSIMGLASDSITSLQALIFPENGYNEDRDPVTPTKVGIAALKDGDFKGFIFDLKEDYRLNLNCDITDHYVENNSAKQDHIALKPIIIEVSGQIAEKNLLTPYDEEENTDKVKKALNTVDSYYNRMGSLSFFAPNIVNQSKQILNTANLAYNTYKTFSGFMKKLGGDKPQTRQFKIVNMFLNYWNSRTSFSIVTPFGVFDNMYILDFSSNQPKNTKYVTEIKIKFKQIQEAYTINKETLYKSQGAQIEENKRYIKEEPTLVEQAALPPLEVEYRTAGDFVKQTVNIARETVITSSERAAKVFSNFAEKLSSSQALPSLAETVKGSALNTAINNYSVFPTGTKLVPAGMVGGI